jgi:hypothetical protein
MKNGGEIPPFFICVGLVVTRLLYRISAGRNASSAVTII